MAARANPDPDFDRALLDRRRRGQSWPAIAADLNRSLSAVKERGYRLNARAPAPEPQPPQPRARVPDDFEPPLPPGHPDSWGLLGGGEYPKPDPVRTAFACIVPCCWPRGEPGTPSFRFCNCDSISGKPYCAEHLSLAYVRLTDPRDDAA